MKKGVGWVGIIVYIQGTTGTEEVTEGPDSQIDR